MIAYGVDIMRLGEVEKVGRGTIDLKSKYRFRNRTRLERKEDYGYSSKRGANQKRDEAEFSKL